jgi:hypothetical protein
MKTDRDFSPISPDETRDLAFDYVNDTFTLNPEEILVSAEFSLAVEATDGGKTADSDPASRKSGAATIAANTAGALLAAVQRVTGCIDGNKYRVTCLATTSRGQVLELYAYLACRSPA